MWRIALMRKVGLFFCFVLILSLLLVACGDEATAVPASTATTAASANLAPIPADKTVTIKYINYNYGTPGLGGKGTQQLIDEFQAKFPNIKVEARNVPSQDTLKAIAAEAAAGDPPDLAQLVLNGLDFIVKNLPAQAINKLVSKEEYADFTKHILPQALKLGVLDGNLYGAPYTFSTPTIFYNADIFKAAGLDPDKPPTNWDEVRKYGQQIKDKTGKPAIVVTDLPQAFDWVVQSVINSNGGTTISADKKKATFNEAPAIEALEMWQGLVKDGINPKLTGADATAAFTSGNLAMYMTSTVLLPSFNEASKGKFDLRTTGMPAFGSKTVRPVNSGSALFMFSKDPLKQRASYEFMKFMSSQRGYTIITGSIGYLPLRDDVLDDPNYLKPILEKETRLQPAIKQLGNLETWVSWPGKDSVQAVKIFMQGVYDVVYDGQDAKKTMDAAAARVDELLKG
jgi:multiple sugar transport system substrate-binding protein